MIILWFYFTLMVSTVISLMCLEDMIILIGNPLSTPHLPLHSLLATPLPTCHSPFATPHLPLLTCQFPTANSLLHLPLLAAPNYLLMSQF